MKSQRIVEIVYLLALALLVVVEGKRQPSLLSKVICRNRGGGTIPDSELHRTAGM